jgi:hypothetical protein
MLAQTIRGVAIFVVVEDQKGSGVCWLGEFPAPAILGMFASRTPRTPARPFGHAGCCAAPIIPCLNDSGTTVRQEGVWLPLVARRRSL